MKIVAANGADIPAVGFGTYGMSRDEMLLIIPAALDAGFRHIDTAQTYRNEAEVGECAAASDEHREVRNVAKNGGIDRRLGRLVDDDHGVLELALVRIA
jgi:diketogulonate reductase-like aldo/keto reductase